MNYVAHICHNPKCNNIWIDKDLTNTKVNPPKWKYCEDCCKKLGIDYDSQTVTSNLTEKQIASRERRAEIARKNFKKVKS